MPITTTPETLLGLLEQKRSSNHHKVALRYFFMLEALGHPIPAAQRRYCGEAMRRCTPRDLERIRSAARDWASFANGSMSCDPSSIEAVFHSDDIIYRTSSDSNFGGLRIIGRDAGTAKPMSSGELNRIALAQVEQLIARLSR